MCTCQRERDAGMIGTGTHAFVTFRRHTISEIGSWIAKYGFGNLGLPVWIQKLRLPIWMAGYFSFFQDINFLNPITLKSSSSTVKSPRKKWDDEIHFLSVEWMDESLLQFSICMDCLQPVTTKIQFLIHCGQPTWSGWYCLFLWTVSWKMTRANITKRHISRSLLSMSTHLDCPLLPLLVWLWLMVVCFHQTSDFLTKLP